MIIFNKLDNVFVVSAHGQTFLDFEMTANFRDTSPLRMTADSDGIFLQQLPITGDLRHSKESDKVAFWWTSIKEKSLKLF